MFSQVELFCVGFAAIVDVVLLLVLLERTNRPLTGIWVKWATTGVTLWHVGSFLHAALRDTPGPFALRLDGVCMTVMAAGLLLLTSAMMHGALRINSVGAVAQPQPDRRYIGVYFPLLFFVPVMAAIFRSETRDFLLATQDYQIAYLTWLTICNVTVAILLLRNRDQQDVKSVLSGRFLVRFSIGLIIVTVLTPLYVFCGPGAWFEPQLRLVTTVSPIVPTLVFAYYIFRRRLLPLVFERTLAYGAILLTIFYLHRLTLSQLMTRYKEDFNFDFVMLEGLLLVTLMLAYAPLRDRIREGLRYLVGINVSRMRNATRQMSVELSRRAADEPESITAWFAGSVVDSLGLRFARVHLNNRDNTTILHLGPDEVQSKIADLFPNDCDEQAAAILHASDARWIDRSRTMDRRQLAMMRQWDLIAAYPIDYHEIQGSLLLGATSRGDRLAEEQLNTISLLVDQFAATLHNRQLEEARQTAERRAVQQEKLSTLGLLSGSLAHELRNPLSSMRTVATLLKEDLTGSASADEVDMIVTEIDRLTQTTQRLLDFSRPADSVRVGVAPDTVIERILHILEHLARQHHVTIRRQLKAGASHVKTTDAALTEVLFNLLKNAIEAARETEGGEVLIASRRADQSIIVEVQDNGPGIPPDQLDTIFEPFVTGKADGTGLGLYIVAERVRESGGTLDCQSRPGETVFAISMPHMEAPAC